MSSAVHNFFEGWPARAGFKFALAGCVSLVLALALRLEEPTWAVTTAFVLSTPKFVGAIAEKTLFRIIGAALGAVSGYLITGSLEQSPVLFIGGMGLLVAFTTMMYGGTFAPYLLRQCGYTATLVAVQGMGNPAFSWQVGLARFEEVCVGIVVTGAVTLLIWPRHAYREIDDGARSVLRSLGTVFETRSAAFFGHGKADEDIGISFAKTGNQLAALRKLIRVADFESRSFSIIKKEVAEIVANLGALTSAIFEVCKTLPPTSVFYPYLESPARALHSAIRECIYALADPLRTTAACEAAQRRAEDALEAYARALEKFRDSGAGDLLPLRQSLDHAGYGMAMREIVASLRELHRLFPLLAAARADGFPRVRLRKPTWPGTEWLLAGLRGGLAVGTALFLVNWAHPPGGDLLVVGTYLFTAFTLESPDLSGDRGAFTWLVQTWFLCLVYFVFLLVFAPLMANTLIFFGLLAAAMFSAGYYSTKGTWNTLQVLFALLIVVSLVGLNAQRPVSFQQIVDSCLGLALAASLATLFRRLLWPVLPQNHFRKRLGELLQSVRTMFASDMPNADTAHRAAFILLAAETQSLAAFLTREDAALHHYISSIVRAGNHMLFYKGELGKSLPLPIHQRFAATSATVKQQVENLLAEQFRVIENPHAPRGEEAPIPAIQNSVFESLRMEIRAVNMPVPVTMQSLAALYREMEIHVASREASAAFARADFARIFADSRL